MVKAIKDLRRNKATGDDNIPVDLLKELGDSGLKIITALVKKICMSGDWPNHFLDVTMIALSKESTQRYAVTTEQLVPFHTLERWLHVS